jgi:hypothetical protein
MTQEEFMKVYGRMINEMDQDSNYLLLEIHIKENINLEKFMEKEFIIG